MFCNAISGFNSFFFLEFYNSIDDTDATEDVVDDEDQIEFFSASEDRDMISSLIEMIA